MTILRYWASNGVIKAVAWCQLIFAIIGIISLGFELSIVMRNVKENCKLGPCIPEKFFTHITDAIELRRKIRSAVWLLFFLEVSWFPWSFVLLHGAYKKDKIYLLRWTATASGYLIGWTALFINLQYWRSWDGGIAVNTKVIVSTWAFQGFSIFMAILSHLEIKAAVIDIDAASLVEIQTMPLEA